MNRVTRKLKIFGQQWKISSLFPFDFLEVGFWPFAYYRLPEDNQNQISEIKRDWKLKPKNMADDEANLKKSIDRALMLGLSIFNASGLEKIRNNPMLKNILTNEIYALTYGLTTQEKISLPIQPISKETAESLAIKSKAMGIEPYALIADLSKEQPELYNPRRYDFNWLILGAGWEREKREIEKAQAELKSRMRRR